MTKQHDLEFSSYRIAKIAGVSVAHTARVLKGEAHARFDTAVKIAKAAGLTLDELAQRVYGQDEPTKKAVAAIEKRRKEASELLAS